MRVAFVLRSIEVYLLVFRFVSPFYQSSSSHSCVHVHIHDLYSPPTFIQYKSTFIKKYTPILTLTQHNTFLLLLFFFGVKCVTLHFFQGRLFWCEVRWCLAIFSGQVILQFFVVRSSCNFFQAGEPRIFSSYTTPHNKSCISLPYAHFWPYLAELNHFTLHHHHSTSFLFFLLPLSTHSVCLLYQHVN